MSFDPRIISSADLTAADVPDPAGALGMERGGEYPAVWLFALSYPAPPTLPAELPGFVAQAVVAGWEAGGALPDAFELDELRLTLWGLHECWRQMDNGAAWERQHPSHASLARALVTQIRTELQNEESWYWDPGHEPTDEDRSRRRLALSKESRDLKELYEAAGRLLDSAIAQRDAGSEDPLTAPLAETDALQAARLDAAYLVARGLLAVAGNASLEDARSACFERASALTP
jgi:hypothetical protein